MTILLRRKKIDNNVRELLEKWGNLAGQKWVLFMLV